MSIMSTRFSRAHLLTEVLSTDNREVILYLYGGAVTYLQRAAEHLAQGRRKPAAENIQRASAIVVELSCCLDFNREGSLALRLDSIYNYLIEVLAVAARTLDTDALETCRSVLAILGDAWRQALESDHRVELIAPSPHVALSR
jgi:flagellar secretion chaperone FliS